MKTYPTLERVLAAPSLITFNERAWGSKEKAASARVKFIKELKELLDAKSDS